MFSHWSQVQDHTAPGTDAALSVQGVVDQHLNDADAVARLRTVAAGVADNVELSRYDDHQVADLLSAALISGRLQPDRQPQALYPLRPLTGRPPGSPTPPQTGRSSAAAPATAAVADTTFDADLDVSAQVDSLLRAARDGVPFCEACARAAETSA